MIRVARYCARAKQHGAVPPGKDLGNSDHSELGNRILNESTHVNCIRCRPGQRAAPRCNWKPGRHEAVNLMGFSDKRHIIQGRSLCLEDLEAKETREVEGESLEQNVLSSSFLLRSYATVETFLVFMSQAVNLVHASFLPKSIQKHIRHGGLSFCASLSAEL